MTVVSRPYRGESDIPALVMLINACADADQTEDHTSVEELAWELEDPELVAGRSVQIWEQAGVPVALAVLSVHQHDAVLDAGIWFRTLPAVRPGFDDLVLTWAITQVERQRQAEGAIQAVLHSGARADQPERLAALTRHGFRERRHYYDMERSLESLPMVQLPQGCRFRQVQGAVDAEAWVLLYNHTFVEHEGFRLLTAVQLIDDMTDPLYRPEGDLLVVDQDDQPVAFVRYWLDEQGRGIIRLLGTRPDQRRRGIGKALLHQACVGLAEFGAQSAWLSVDTPSPHSVLHWYLREGFVVQHTIVVCERQIGG